YAQGAALGGVAGLVGGHGGHAVAAVSQGAARLEAPGAVADGGRAQQGAAIVHLYGGQGLVVRGRPREGRLALAGDTVTVRDARVVAAAQGVDGHDRRDRVDLEAIGLGSLGVAGNIDAVEGDAVAAVARDAEGAAVGLRSAAVHAVVGGGHAAGGV